MKNILIQKEEEIEKREIQSNVTIEFNEYLEGGSFQLASDIDISYDSKNTKFLNDLDSYWDHGLWKKLKKKKINTHEIWNSLRMWETIQEIREINWHYLINLSEEDIRILLYNIQYRRPNTWYRIQKRIEKQQRLPNGRFDLYQRQTGFSNFINIYRSSSDPIN